MTKKELLIGCGSNHKKKLYEAGKESWSNLTTLDINPGHKPDIVWDLCTLPLPFNDSQFDEIHAYEVLEHTGAQGDYKFFFNQFSEFHRILVPNGTFHATVPAPSSPWAFGDPSHTRLFCKEWLIFLNQDTYDKQVGVTSMSDFRGIYKASFEILMAEERSDTLYFIIQAIK